MDTKKWNILLPRERDILVAEKLFGNDTPSIHTPAYTTDPAACSLVKALCEYYTVAKERGGYIAMVQLDGKTGIVQQSRQPTEELAVCLAALKAG